LWVPVLAAVLAVVVLPVVAAADEWKTVEDDRWCRDGHWNDDSEAYCEVREITLPADRDVIRVDGGANGGIEVEGWDKNEIRIRVKVKAWSREDEEEARETVGKIVVVTDGRDIRAEGPKMGRREGWAVSFRLMVPKKSNLDLEATNGGIAVSDVEGEIVLDTTNGGLSIANLSGDVRGRTTNGGLHVQLTGNAWKGEGLDVVSTNGGVDLEIPEGYSAELETGTVNGGIEVDFPVTVQGRIGKSFKATLGEGGAMIRVKTTNGGVRSYRG
jgi:DUF4097 and DUF4098 domain-containing protein YvlB